MRDLFPFLGPWTWWIIAAVMLLLELAIPGVFFMWLAGAAAVLGIFTFLFPLAWQYEIAIFAILAVIFLLVLRPRFKGRLEKSDRPNLGQRMYDYVGRRYVLEEPIVDGRGRIRIEDTTWEILGPDRAKGEWITVTGVEGLRLRVEAANGAT
jgi:membrane protein implicated in regulation of membrane protease activity